MTSDDKMPGPVRKDLSVEQETADSDRKPKAKAKAKGLDRRFDAYFLSGLAVGLALVAGGFFFQAMNPISARLAFVCGLGIVLGAFGTTATVNFKPYVIGGCGAIALILGWFLAKEVRESYVLLQIDGVPTGADVQIYGERNFYGAELQQSSIYEFVAMESHFGSRVIGAVVVSSDGDEFPFQCISSEAKQAITNAIGGESKVYWTFDREAGALYDDAGKVIAEVRGRCQRGVGPGPTSLEFNVFGTAFAAALPPIDQLLKEIQSDSVLDRRTARDLLGGYGPAAVKPSLLAFSAPNASYRTRLGVLVGLTQMLRDNKGERKAISSDVTDEQLGLLVKAAADPDRTIRIYASEFLFDLGDPRSVSMALDQIAGADENGRYNLLIVIKGAIGELEATDRATADAQLRAFDFSRAPETQALVDQIVDLSNPATAPKFWVIVGSFKDEVSAKEWSETVNSEDPSLKAFVGRPRPDNPVFPVIVGDYVDRAAAEELKRKALSTKTIVDAYLSDHPDYKP